ncbi:hypothetical protein CF319_g7253 [Tilletia indica]|nr:hypothetical protein CF319_g7253 [Tilletia indica]
MAACNLAHTHTAGNSKPQSRTPASTYPNSELIGAEQRRSSSPSGAMESNNMSIKGVARFYKGHKNHIITTQTEHKCVLDSCRRLTDEGLEITYLPVGTDGLIDPKDLEAALRLTTSVVSMSPLWDM